MCKHESTRQTEQNWIEANCIKALFSHFPTQNKKSFATIDLKKKIPRKTREKLGK